MTKEQVTGQRADGLVRQAEQTVCDPLCFTASSALVLFARAQSCSSLNPRPHGKRSDCPPRASACPLRATHTLAQSHPPFSPRARQLTRPTPLPRLGLQLVETQTYRTRTRIFAPEKKYLILPRVIVHQQPAAQQVALLRYRIQDERTRRRVRLRPRLLHVLDLERIGTVANTAPPRPSCRLHLTAPPHRASSTRLPLP